MADKAPPADPSPKQARTAQVQTIEERGLLIVEGFLLRARYLLVPFYCALMFLVCRLIVDFFKLLWGTSNSAHLIEHTMQALELLDITMIANLIWFIAAGSYYVFVHPHPDTSTMKRPRSLAHISTGILKEKMAGSLIGVSSVYLLHKFLQITTTNEAISMRQIAVLLAIHVVFIAGLLAFNYTNKADHRVRQDSQDAPKQ